MNSAGKRRDIWFSAVILLCCLGLYFIPSPPPLAKQTGKPVAAEVVAVDNSQVEQHGLVRFGSQKLTVRLLNPKYKGAQFTANNELRAQMELDKEFMPGDTAVVILQEADKTGGSVLVAQDHYRLGWGLALFAGFCLLLCWFGGWTGAKALFSFVFSCLMIWKAVIPLVLRGWSASWLIFGSVCVLTAVIVYLVAGVTKKGIAAFAGSAAGI